MTFAQAFEAAKKEQARTGKKSSGGFFVHLLGFLCCLVMPAFWTAIAPVATTSLTREDGKVRAVARHNLFFVIPYRTAVVEDLRKVNDRYESGDLVWSRRNGERHKHRTEAESFLVLHGEGKAEPVEVSVSPVNRKSAVKKVEDFLKDPSQTKTRVITVANWKFSVIGGVFVTLLATLYVTGVILSVFRFFGRLLIPDGVVEKHPAVLVR